MVLKNDINVPDFIKTVQCCSGEVLFKTEDGDCLNLKSALSQFIFAVAFYKLSDLHYCIVCDNKDRELLLPFLEEVT